MYFVQLLGSWYTGQEHTSILYGFRFQSMYRLKMCTYIIISVHSI